MSMPMGYEWCVTDEEPVQIEKNTFYAHKQVGLHNNRKGIVYKFSDPGKYFWIEIRHRGKGTKIIERSERHWDSDYGYVSICKRYTSIQSFLDYKNSKIKEISLEKLCSQVCDIIDMDLYYMEVE